MPVIMAAIIVHNDCVLVPVVFDSANMSCIPQDRVRNVPPAPSTVPREESPEPASSGTGTGTGFSLGRPQPALGMMPAVDIVSCPGELSLAGKPRAPPLVLSVICVGSAVEKPSSALLCAGKVRRSSL